MGDIDTSNTVNRRAVVRGAANVAWMVPAITLATAVPAIAASTTPAMFTIASNPTWTNAGSGSTTDRYSYNSVITNTGGDAGDATPTVTMSFAGLTSLTGFTPPAVAGFTVTSTSVLNGVVTVVYEALAPVPAGGSIPFVISNAPVPYQATGTTATVSTPDPAGPTTVTTTSPAQFVFTQSSTTYNNTGATVLTNDSVAWDMAVTNYGGTAATATVTVDVGTLISVGAPSAPAVTGWNGATSSLIGLLGWRWTYTTTRAIAPGETYQFDRSLTNISGGAGNVTWTLQTAPAGSPTSIRRP